MKTNTNPLAALVAALFITFLAPASWAQGTIVNVYGGVINRYASAADYDTLINAVRNGTPQSANWTYYPSGSTVPLTSIFNNGSTGGMYRAALAATSPTKFTLEQIQIVIENSVFDPTSPSFTSYSNLGIGVDSGQDGVLGTADDITYNSGNGNTPVNAVYLRGVGRTISIGSTPLDEALSLWSNFTFENATFTVNGVSGSDRMNFGVPEPSSAALLTFGLIGLRILKKKR